MNICSQPEQSKVEIDSFSGAFRFLSNFYSAPLLYEGVLYPTSEHAFQAAKTLDHNQRLNVAMLETPAESKRYGKTVPLRPAWDDIKIGVMEEIVEEKFRQNPKLAEMLLATEDAILIEGNTWGDKFWGVCNGVGENNLGKVLMYVRDCLNKEKEDNGRLNEI